jgi:hypothetical protein
MAVSERVVVAVQAVLCLLVAVDAGNGSATPLPSRSTGTNMRGSSSCQVDRDYASPLPVQERNGNRPGAGKVTGFLDHGKWCGPKHGGYDDCCNGEACPACEPGKQPPSEECFGQCTPVDVVDAACGRHDACSTVVKPGSGEHCNTPDTTACTCDCPFLSEVQGILQHHGCKGESDPDSCTRYSEAIMLTFCLGTCYQPKIKDCQHVKDNCATCFGECVHEQRLLGGIPL